MLRASSFLVAVALVLLVAASSAGAHEFRSEIAPTLFQGEQTGSHIFENTSNESKIVCGKAIFLGTTSATQTGELKVALQYSECTFGKTVTLVKMNGCEYEFFGATNASEHAELKIVCPPGKQMEIEVGSLCTAKIVAATYWGVRYVNKGFAAARDFEVVMTPGEIQYEKTGLSCATVFGNGKDMRFTGTFTAKGYEDFGGTPGNQRGVWVS